MSISSVASVVRDKKEQLQRRQGPALLLHARSPEPHTLKKRTRESEEELITGRGRVYKERGRVD